MPRVTAPASSPLSIRVHCKCLQLRGAVMVCMRIHRSRESMYVNEGCFSEKG